MKNRQIDNKSKQVRIDSGLHKLLKLEAAKRSMLIKALVEECLAELLAVEEK